MMRVKYISGFLVLIFCCLTCKVGKAFVDRDLREGLLSSFCIKPKLSIVFAAENIQIPISQFGHVYLMAHDNIFSPDNVALEFVGETNSAMDYFYALFTSTTGVYRLRQAPMKLKEYGLENRTLYFFELRITAEQRHKINTLVANRSKPSIKFPYNFATFNCAYYISKLLGQVIFPDEFLSPFPFMSPTELIKSYEYKNLFEEKLVVLPTRQLAIESYKNLSVHEQKQLQTLLRGYRANDGQVTDCSNQLAEAINNTCNFVLEQERRPGKRQHIFNLKQWAIMQEQITQNQTISHLPSDRKFWSGQLSGSFTTKKNLLFSYQPLQLTVFDQKVNHEFNSLLDIAKVEVNCDPHMSKNRLESLNLIRLEAHNPDNFLLESFSRYLDLSYYNWQLLDSNKSEIVMRFGVGKALGYKKLNFGMIPYAGIRYLTTAEGKEIREDFGLKASALLGLTAGMKVRSSFTHYFRTPFVFTNIWELGLYIDRSAQGVFITASGSELHTTWASGIYQQI